MKTVRRLLHGQIIGAVAYTTLAFLALFFFFDLVEELQDVGKHGVTTAMAFAAAALSLPKHFYEVFPITLLIGSIVALSRLAQTSEYTILRTGGLGPMRALQLLLGLACAGVVVMILVGDVLVPHAEHWSTTKKAALRSSDDGRPIINGGVWLRQAGPSLPEPAIGPAATGVSTSPGTVTVNIGSAASDKQFYRIRIFVTNGQGELVRLIRAEAATVSESPSSGASSQSTWLLQQVSDQQWTQQGAVPVVVSQKHLTMPWMSTLSPQVVAAAVLPIDTMSVMELWRYAQHLSRNAQSAQKYELAFWKKLLAPWACLVMMSLSLPFAYLQARQGGMSLKVFGGIMLGISFVLVNHVTSHLGLLHQWRPWLAASLPSLAYTFLALMAFTWLVRNR